MHLIGFLFGFGIFGLMFVIGYFMITGTLGACQAVHVFLSIVAIFTAITLLGERERDEL